MSMPQPLSVGLGVVLRAIINSVFARNDKLAGVLSGIWDGIVAYTAWHTDRLLEPLVLIEIIVGVCFDALFHGTPTRLVSLALGCALGVVISDTAGLDTIWDAFGENVQKKLKDLDIKDDLDSPDVLSEFSEDVTVIYEEPTVNPRTRKMSTAEWIAAQRKARSSKSTSRRASASMNISTDLDKSLLLSGFDTQTQVTTQTQSSRGRRDKELLATMTPLAPPSVAKSADFNIDVVQPSASSRVSSPTIKTEKIEQPFVHNTNEGTAIDKSKVSSPPKSSASKSDRTVRREASSVKPEMTGSARERPLAPSSAAHHSRQLEKHSEHPAPSEHSDHSTVKDRRSQTPWPKRSATDDGSFIPFIPPRPPSTRQPTVISAVHSHSRTPSQRSPQVVPAHAFRHAAADVPSFVPFSPDDDLRERLTRSRASTRHTEHLEQDYVQSAQDHQPTVRSKSSAHPAGSPAQYSQEYPGSTARSEFSGYIHHESPVSPVPPPEVIIDYSGETTRIYIPPPAETGINVRIVPHVEESQHDLVEETSEDLLHPSEDRRSQSASGSHLHSHDILYPSHSIGSFPELETVPPDEGHSINEEQRSRASRAELSSDPQPPSIFKLKTAWRDSAPLPSSSATEYGGRVVESDDPLPVYVAESVEQHSESHVTRSRSHSPSPPRRSRSASSRHSHGNANTLDLDMRGGEGENAAPDNAKTPSVEWFGPARAHSTSRLRGRSDASRKRRSGPIPIARSEGHGHRQSSTFVSSPTVDESIISHQTKTSLHTRAQQLEQQAKDMDARCRTLQEQIRGVQAQGRNALAFTLGFELEVVEDQARKLHRRAERALNAARNAEPEDDKVDVHHLSVLEAVAAVKTALYVVQQRGGSQLTVIVDKGRRAAEGSSVRKNVIIDKIVQKYNLGVRTDDTNPNVIHIILPQTS